MRNLLIIGLSAATLCGCTDNALYPDLELPATITGNTYQSLARQSRSLSLDASSRILLNAWGGLQADNEVLSYSGQQWETSNTLNWHETEETACITALHPVYPDLTYTEENLYENGTLQDILFVKNDFPARQAIRFQFKHLFSSLTLHLTGILKESFQKLEIKCPVVVSSVDAITTQVALDYNKEHTTSIVQPEASGIYSLIIPPAENVPITITIYTSDKMYTTQLPTRSYTGNQDYQYKIKVTEQQGPGIATAEEFIAFSILINSKITTEYNGKTLKDFGETIDGVTTYRLLNDIDFEGVNCSKLEHIGNTSRYFNDIFDGQGYTISNLTLKSAYSTTGIFGHVGKTGVIKNLHAKSCGATITGSSSSGAGVIAGLSLGTILNCSVENCTLTSAQGLPLGGIVGASQNAIINCQVQNSVLNSLNSTGGIAGSSSGVVLNCFSVYNKIESDDSYYGGICGMSINNPTIISNCYIYSLSLKKKSYCGLIVGAAKSSTITHCYYTSSGTIGLTGSNKDTSNNKLSDNISYNSNFTDTANGIPIYELLNQWIDTEAPTLYPDITFLRWEKDEENNLPAIFMDR